MKKSVLEVNLTEHRVENTAESSYTENNQIWCLKNFKSRFRVSVFNLEGLEMEVDIIGISCSVANAIRRILLSEIPSMAVEKVFIANNTTLIKDEVLAHRLGLVPLKADPRLFDYPTDGMDEANEQNTLVYEMKVKCTSNADGNKNSSKACDKYKNHTACSKDFRWLPQGNQASVYREKDVCPVYPDILLDKLRPGQQLDLKMHAVKGIGRDHAKFSPVATAYYRMLPKIELLREVKGESAERLKKCFSEGVIGTETIDGEIKAVVLNARYDSCSRNVLRYDDLKDAVAMSRVRDHFIFHVESVGALPPDVLFQEAVKVLKSKCTMYLQKLSQKM